MGAGCENIMANNSELNFENIRRLMENAIKQHQADLDTYIFGNGSWNDVTYSTKSWWRDVQPNAVEQEVNDVQDVVFD